MRRSTLDPISLNAVTDLENAPFIIEGDGDNAIQIYFESIENRDEYLDMEVHGSVNLPGLKKIFDDMADNPNTGSIN